jgi:Uncharacterised conserved protein
MSKYLSITFNHVEIIKNIVFRLFCEKGVLHTFYEISKQKIYDKDVVISVLNSLSLIFINLDQPNHLCNNIQKFFRIFNMN